MTISESAAVHKRIDALIRTQSSKKRIGEIKSVLVLSTLWYQEIIEDLKKSLREFFYELDVHDDRILFKDVPGALELPYAARMGVQGKLIGQSGRPDMIVVLGCVQQGATPHFDFVCNTAFDGLMDVQLNHKIPMGYGLLTVKNLDQARERTNKGFEAAQAALFMYLSSSTAEVE